MSQYVFGKVKRQYAMSIKLAPQPPAPPDLPPGSIIPQPPPDAPLGYVLTDKGTVPVTEANVDKLPPVIQHVLKNLGVIGGNNPPPQVESPKPPCNCTKCKLERALMGANPRWN